MSAKTKNSLSNSQLGQICPNPKCPTKTKRHTSREEANKCLQMMMGRTSAGTNTGLSKQELHNYLKKDFIVNDDDEISVRHAEEREMLTNAVRDRLDSGKTRKVKNKVRVAFDLDGVCADLNTYLAPHSFRDWEVCPVTYDFVKAEWFSGWGQKEGEFGLYHDEVMHRAYDLPFNDHNISQAVQKLQNHSMNGGPEYEIFFLTDRPDFAHESSVEFVRRAGVNMDNHELIITGGKKKSTFNPDYLVDDAPKNIVDMFSNTEDGIGMTYNQRYNEHLHVDGVPRARNLIDYADFIINRENNMRNS